MNEPLLTRLEAQKILRVSQSTMFRLIHRGELPVVQVGSTYRIRQSDLVQYLEQNNIKHKGEKTNDL